MPQLITVQSIGGLGKQLFGYYVGVALAARQKTTLRLDTTWTRHGITDHGIGILKCDLPGEWIASDSLRAKLSAPGTTPVRAVAESFRNICALGAPLRIHEAPGVSHDPALQEQPPRHDCAAAFSPGRPFRTQSTPHARGVQVSNSLAPRTTT